MKTIFIIFNVCVQLVMCKVLPDWLVRKIDYPADLVENTEDHTITLTNGLVSRIFTLSPGFVTTDLYSHEKNSSVLRALGPEVLCFGDTCNDEFIMIWVLYYVILSCIICIFFL